MYESKNASVACKTLLDCSKFFFFIIHLAVSTNIQICSHKVSGPTHAHSFVGRKFSIVCCVRISTVDYLLIRKYVTVYLFQKKTFINWKR